MPSAAVLCCAVLQGRVVSFKNAIIILTSNLGSAEIFNAAYKQKKEGGQVAGEGFEASCTRSSSTTVVAFTGYVCIGQIMPPLRAFPSPADLTAVLDWSLLSPTIKSCLLDVLPCCHQMFVSL
jgi:hypothetical protein